MFCSYDSVVLVIVSAVNSSGCGYAVVSYTSGVVTVCNRPFACKDSKVCNITSRVQSQHQLLKYGRFSFSVTHAHVGHSSLTG